LRVGGIKTGFISLLGIGFVSSLYEAIAEEKFDRDKLAKQALDEILSVKSSYDQRPE